MSFCDKFFSNLLKFNIENSVFMLNSPENFQKPPVAN